MLPLSSKILFFLFALIVGGIGAFGFYRLFLRIKRGAPATEPRLDHLPERIGAAIITTLTQERVFRRRTAISIFHSFIFYGFTYYLLVNVIDGLEGYFNFHILSSNPVGAVYNLLADLMSFLVLVGVVALVIRRLYLPSKRDFKFNGKSLLHPWVQRGYIKRDSLIVSAFICFHVGSRLVGNSAKMVEESRTFYNGAYDSLQPFASFLGSHLFGGLSDSAIEGWRVFGYWGALASVIAFLSYFPYTKHIHLFMAPLNYAFKRPVHSGTLPPMKGLEEAIESEDPKLGVEKLEDLEWPRLLDAYACIQCNRCQDVCPANATGKALSPAALEINKRMQLNELALHQSPFVIKTTEFEQGAVTELPMLEFAINEESVWACTTCGACMQVCPVQDEQMLDIIDIRRQQVMVAGEFPAQLQTAFRGMERTQNPWGISRDKRFEWADGLKVPTIDENPAPDVLYWVGCAASYDPGAQKVARSFVQLLDKAGVNYAVLGKKEACTGDSARRAGNEFLYQTLAQENVETLNAVNPKLIVATCPHCMNMIGNEYPQLGGNYATMHHTQYLEMLVEQGALKPEKLEGNVTYHDPCYLGRHNGVYDAPRSVIRSMGLEILELERSRENSFCCGAGGAQFWKEEEEGSERISDNRFKEIQARLDAAKEGKVLAVGCPFCKSMFNSTPEKQVRDDVVVKDVAELMLEGIQRASGEWVEPAAPASESVETPNTELPTAQAAPEPMTPLDKEAVQEGVVGTTSAEVDNAQPAPAPAAAPRKKWGAKDDVSAAPVEVPAAPAEGAPRKKWGAKTDDVVAAPVMDAPAAEAAPARKKWGAKSDDVSVAPVSPAPVAPAEAAPASESAAPARKKWGAAKTPATSSDDVSPAPVTAEEAAQAAAPTEGAPRKKWGKAAASSETPAPTEAAPAPSNSPAAAGERPKWSPKAKAEAATTPPVAPAPAEAAPAPQPVSGERPKWAPKAQAQATPTQAKAEAVAVAPAEATAPAPEAEAPANAEASSATGRKKWNPKG